MQATLTGFFRCGVQNQAYWGLFENKACLYCNEAFVGLQTRLILSANKACFFLGGMCAVFWVWHIAEKGGTACVCDAAFGIVR